MPSILKAGSLFGEQRASRRKASVTSVTSVTSEGGVSFTLTGAGGGPSGADTNPSATSELGGSRARGEWLAVLMGCVGLL